MAINFERLVSRSVARQLSRELDLAGIKSNVNRILSYLIGGAILILIVGAFTAFFSGLGVGLSFIIGLGAAAFFIAFGYVYLEYLIDKRKGKMEESLPDYFQIASANLRSGISLDRALLLAARPEFGSISEDIRDMSRRIFGGETLENALRAVGDKYRSYQLTHAIRMILEALRYGGGLADLLGQIAKEIRAQQIVQKEVSGQLFMYSIFIVFAGLIAAPVLYGLTGQMIGVTDAVWKGILASNPGGLPSIGVSFLKPSPPVITAGEYKDFSLAAIIVVTGFASLIMSAINSGNPLRGLKYLPVFILAGIGIYFVVSQVLSVLFAGIGAAA
ncbi:type II secretion system F family protein [Candidatus Marsarchaeota archaeon]|nr:type II secretion system F family protein [Candidatus Marsarchaeota archaeon]